MTRADWEWDLRLERFDWSQLPSVEHLLLDDEGSSNDGSIVTQKMIDGANRVLQQFAAEQLFRPRPDWLHNVGAICLILSIIQEERFLSKFDSKNIDDSTLPLPKDALIKICGDDQVASRFLHQQYLVKPRSVESDHHIVFGDSEPLPLQVRERLGSGGFGVVDKVVHTVSKKAYARKTWHKKSFYEYLEIETSAMKRLRGHRHIVELISTYERGNELCLLMSPVADYSLRDMLDTPLSLPTDPRWEILYRALGCLSVGLAFIHHHQIRHKDIKPANVLVRGDNVLWTDFGLAFDYSELSRSTTTGPKGFQTLHYSPPEVINETARGRKSDVFMLGCVFLEILSAIFFEESEAEGAIPTLKPFHDHIWELKDWISRRKGAITITLTNSKHAMETWLEIVRWMIDYNISQRPEMEEVVEHISNRLLGSSEQSIFLCEECHADIRLGGISCGLSADHSSPQPFFQVPDPPPQVSSPPLSSSNALPSYQNHELPPPFPDNHNYWLGLDPMADLGVSKYLFNS
ncbi:MAG: hypothetical protein M1833_000632 [Piccolia ochrophora]|nr:MAG: hypothetical protein M1833_000632 [Piccolia ochrophora]